MVGLGGRGVKTGLMNSGRGTEAPDRGTKAWVGGV